MAVEMSARLLQEMGPRHHPLTHALVRLRRFRSALRKLDRKFRKPQQQACKSPATITRELESTKAQFREKGWSYVDPFFEEEFVAELIQGWPQRRYFAPMQSPFKSYDIGFKWSREAKQTEFVEHFPALKAAYSLLCSPEFSKRVTDFCDDGISRSCFSIGATWATAGSALIPHRDTVATDQSGRSFINIVIFIDANGRAPHAGGTCIAADNEYKRILFEPTNLRNSALVYQSTAEFFHGFKPLAPGAFRWSINAQFCDIHFK